MRFLPLLASLFLSFGAFCQGFEVSLSTDFVRGRIGETLKVPMKIRNTSEKTISIVIRRIDEQIGTTQRTFLCSDPACQDVQPQDLLVRVEPGAVHTLLIGLESGLVSTSGSIRYIVYNRLFPTQPVETELAFQIEENTEKHSLYHSRELIIKDFYPNPVIDHAWVDYQIVGDRTEAKIQIRNLLGNILAEFPLNSRESQIRIKTDEFAAGIYFYTVVVNNESVMTRKLVIRK